MFLFLYIVPAIPFQTDQGDGAFVRLRIEKRIASRSEEWGKTPGGADVTKKAFSPKVIRRPEKEQ